MKKLINITAFLLLVSSLSFAQRGDYTNEAGYFNFGDFEALESGEMVAEVIIEEHLIKMVAKLSRNEDEEMFNLLNGLKLIKANVFEVTESNEKLVKEKIDHLNNEMKDSNWDRIVRFRDRTESANVYIRTDGSDKIVGLVVAAFDKDGEAAFVNIVGNIDLETIGRLGDKFDVPGLDNISSDKEEK